MGIFRKNCYMRPAPRVGMPLEALPPMPAPNPAHFKVLRLKEFGSKFEGYSVVAEVTYPDCTNYEGRKILVFRGKRSKDLLSCKTLDPHFTQGSGPFARFEPTEEGWKIACFTAEKLLFLKT